MIDKVLQYIMKYNMITDGDKIVVGVSGGADSVCLFYTLKEIQKKIPFSMIVVHVEHGLRGEESVGDAEYVNGICRKEEVPFELFSVNLYKEAADRKCSLEEAGRIVRYEAFRETLAKYQADKIAVAHNQNDRGETMLFNLFRGTGLRGLVGITPVRENIIRPLLCVNRSEIEGFLNKKGIEFRTDYTNFENMYTRNKIRNNIIPYIEREIQPKTVEHISDSCQVIEEVEEYMQSQALKAFHECVRKENDNSFEINLAAFELLENIIKTYVIRLSIGYLVNQLKDITSTHIKDVLGLCSKGVGKKLQLPYQLEAERGYHTLTIRKSEALDVRNDRSITINGAGTYPIDREKYIKISMEDYHEGSVIEEKKYTKWLDYGKIKEDLLLRHRQPGDYLCINANMGKQMLKAYLINEKIPQNERDGLWLLASGNHIIWIVGFRISEAYKVTKDTQRIVKVQYFGGNEDE